jgi:acetolactate synthase-1/3 small subunit
MVRKTEVQPRKQHLFSILVENRPGILARVAGLFAARGYNIDSLTVAESVDPTLSRITCVSSGDDRTVEQIVKQLGKLIDVTRVTHVPLNGQESRAREIMLFRMRARDANREEILDLARRLGARIVSTTRATMDWEVTGTPSTIRALLHAVEPLGIAEMVRSGPVALLSRGTGRRAATGRAVSRTNERTPGSPGPNAESDASGRARLER